MPDSDVQALGADEIHLWWLPWQRGDDRGGLRVVLASYLGIEAEAVHFASGTHGKPFLAGKAQRLRFNWSHCAGLVLLAIALDNELGVDIEHRSRRTDALGIARRWFAPAELALLEPLQDAERANAFASLWTVKEAVLKALGQGLSFGIGQVQVGLRTDGVPTLHSVADLDAASAGWQLLHPQAPLPGIASAVAWQGPQRKLRVFNRIGANADCPTRAC